MVNVKVNSNKSFLKSKSLWAATLGFLAFIVQGFTGFIISPELQGMGLMIVLAVLRLVTKENIVWQ
jgi:hypothetical protein